jgi:hypothetical protein
LFIARTVVFACAAGLKNIIAAAIFVGHSRRARISQRRKHQQ